MILRVAVSRLLPAILALGLGSLACNIGLSGPTPPAPRIPVSTEAAGDLESMIATAVEGAQNGRVSIVITEEQLTSYVAVRLAQEPDSALRDAQVYLRDGKVFVHATATAGAVTMPVQIGFIVSTTPEGRLSLALDEAGLGPVPVPSSVLNAISEGLNEVVAGQFGPQATGFRITDAVVTDGQMLVTGTVTR
jgi:hypothetical protein